MSNLENLPADLPAPIDDGACNHLVDTPLPHIPLLSTLNTLVDLSTSKGWLVIYCYPMTGRPGTPLPAGWDETPGARGCTPESCNFRDNFTLFSTMNVQVFGLSTQPTDYQLEAATRLKLPYPLLSDAQLALTQALNLPTFEVENMHLIKRLSLLAYDGVIKKVFYPVFPPDKHAEEILDWLQHHG